MRGLVRSLMHHAKNVPHRNARVFSVESAVRPGPGPSPPHKSVLLEAVMNSLAPASPTQAPRGEIVFVDGTLGAAGHSLGT